MQRKVVTLKIVSKVENEFKESALHCGYRLLSCLNNTVLLIPQARLEAAKGVPFEPTKQPGGGGGSGGGTLNQCQNCIEVRSRNLAFTFYVGVFRTSGFMEAAVKDLQKKRINF